MDRSHFVYVQYVRNEHYLCSSLMMLEALHRLRLAPKSSARLVRDEVGAGGDSVEGEGEFRSDLNGELYRLLTIRQTQSKRG